MAFLPVDSIAFMTAFETRFAAEMLWSLIEMKQHFRSGKSNAKYYKAFFPKKLKRKNDLLAAYVTIYDAKYLPMFRIPIMMKKNGKVEGASIYFKNLINTNKDYKEWIA